LNESQNQNKGNKQIIYRKQDEQTRKKSERKEKVMTEKELEIKEAKEAIETLREYCIRCENCDNCDEAIKKWCTKMPDSVLPNEWEV